MLLSRETLSDKWRRWADERRASREAAPARRHRTVDHDKLDRQAMKRELVELDRHTSRVEGMLRNQRSPDTAREFEHELAQLAVVRRELVESHAAPITMGRDGRPLPDHLRAYRRGRTVEMRDLLWGRARLAAKGGDRLSAIRLRCDAMRARLIVEREMRLRSSLRGYF